MRRLFETFDGTLFETEEAAEEYERLNLKDIIVVVDDDPEILEILSSKLKREQINHKTFQDPFEAMNFISKNRIEHVFTDYHMKGFGMSGKWIKETCNQHGINCSFVSGDDAVADINKVDFIKDCMPFIKVNETKI